MAQFLRPASDTSAGAWLPSTGSTLYGTIDESSASDADYDYTESESTFEVALSTGTDPSLSTGHIVRYRAAGNDVLDLIVTLKQGATPIAQWTEPAASSTFTDYSHTLSGGEADAITDYTALSLHFEAVTASASPPTFVSAGTEAFANSGNVTPGLPSGWAADDIQICICYQQDAQDSLSITGFTKFMEVNDSTSFSKRFTAAWRRAVGGDSAPTVSGATTDIVARITAWRGCVGSGSPIDGTPTTQVTSSNTTINASAITDLATANCMILFAGVGGTQTNIASVSGYSGTDPTFAEAYDHGDFGNLEDYFMALAYGTKTDTSSTGARTATIGGSPTAVVNIGALIALRP